MTTALTSGEWRAGFANGLPAGRRGGLRLAKVASGESRGNVWQL